MQIPDQSLRIHFLKKLFLMTSLNELFYKITFKKMHYVNLPNTTIFFQNILFANLNTLKSQSDTPLVVQDFSSSFSFTLDHGNCTSLSHSYPLNWNSLKFLVASTTRWSTLTPLFVLSWIVVAVARLINRRFLLSSCALQR